MYIGERVHECPSHKRPKGEETMRVARRELTTLHLTTVASIAPGCELSTVGYSIVNESSETVFVDITSDNRGLSIQGLPFYGGPSSILFSETYCFGGKQDIQVRLSAGGSDEGD